MAYWDSVVGTYLGFITLRSDYDQVPISSPPDRFGDHCPGRVGCLRAAQPYQERLGLSPKENFGSL